MLDRTKYKCRRHSKGKISTRLTTKRVVSDFFFIVSLILPRSHGQRVAALPPDALGRHAHVARAAAVRAGFAAPPRAEAVDGAHHRHEVGHVADRADRARNIIVSHLNAREKGGSESRNIIKVQQKT